MEDVTLALPKGEFDGLRLCDGLALAHSVPVVLREEDSDIVPLTLSVELNDGVMETDGQLETVDESDCDADIVGERLPLVVLLPLFMTLPERLGVGDNEGVTERLVLKDAVVEREVEVVSVKAVLADMERVPHEDGDVEGEGRLVREGAPLDDTDDDKHNVLVGEVVAHVEGVTDEHLLLLAHALAVAVLALLALLVGEPEKVVIADAVKVALLVAHAHAVALGDAVCVAFAELVLMALTVVCDD